MSSFASAMKAVTALICTLLFSVQTFSTWLWVLDYQLNKEYIAKNLCVNKGKPQLHCNGKCQLFKKLAEEENNKTSGTTSLKENSNTVFFKQDIEEPRFLLGQFQLKHKSFYVLKVYACERAPVFHPPAV